MKIIAPNIHSLIVQFIKATPGPRTDDRILEVIHANPQGITAKQIAKQIGRPISMVQICLKSLLSRQKITYKSDRESGQGIYSYRHSEDSYCFPTDTFNPAISSKAKNAEYSLSCHKS
jgi:hypothetical protein